MLQFLNALPTKASEFNCFFRYSDQMTDVLIRIDHYADLTFLYKKPFDWLCFSSLVKLFIN